MYATSLSNFDSIPLHKDKFFFIFIHGGGGRCCCLNTSLLKGKILIFWKILHIDWKSVKSMNISFFLMSFFPFSILSYKPEAYYVAFHILIFLWRNLQVILNFSRRVKAVLGRSSQGTQLNMYKIL